MLNPATPFLRAVLTLWALASGVAPFWLVTLFVGYLSAIAIPPGYFAYFERQHSGLALLLVNKVTVALPLAVLGFLWSLITFRFVRLPVVPVAVFCLFGYLLGVGYSFVEAVWSFLALEAEGKVPLAVFLRSGLTWSYAPIVAAVPLGIFTAMSLRARAFRPAR
jgi:hypothetical protein